MEIRSILPVYSNTKKSITKIHYTPHHFIRVSRTPGDPATKILSIIDHDLTIIKFKDIEAAFFEILSIKNFNEFILQDN